MFPLIGLIIGLLIGLLWNVDIPQAYSSYVAVGILAVIDSVVGAMTANLQNRFNLRLFVTGFLGNSAIAVALAALGDQLDLQLSLAAVFALAANRKPAIPNTPAANTAHHRALTVQQYGAVELRPCPNPDPVARTRLPATSAPRSRSAAPAGWFRSWSACSSSA